MSVDAFNTLALIVAPIAAINTVFALGRRNSEAALAWSAVAGLAFTLWTRTLT